MKKADKKAKQEDAEKMKKEAAKQETEKVKKEEAKQETENEKKEYGSKEYNEDAIREHYHMLTQELIRRKFTITTMESATAGQIASLITDTEGSSAVLKGAFVTYCNEAKIRQGVPADVIETYTVYSKETASAMADACRRAYQADIGIGVTGTMGNTDPANPEASVPGQVYFAVSTEMGTTAWERELMPQPSRLMYKLAAAEEIFEEIRKEILR